VKVIVINATGSQKLEALLDKTSGVIEFKDGEISHVLHEKNMNKTILACKEDEPVVTPTNQSAVSKKKVKK
jgi:hypothetical protein